MIKNISMYRGDTLSFEVDATEIEATVTSIYFSAKRSKKDSSYAFQETLGHGITETETMKYIVRVAPEDTVNLECGKYHYDLQIGLGADVYTFLEGDLMLLEDVTREVH